MQQGGSKGVLGALLILGGIVLAYAVLTGRAFSPTPINASENTAIGHGNTIPPHGGSGPMGFNFNVRPGDIRVRSMGA